MEMYEGLGHVVLATGEQVEVGVVIGPDAEWAERLERFLGHKGEPWNWQNRQVLRACFLKKLKSSGRMTSKTIEH